MSERIKVEVGQVWAYADDRWSYRITRIDLVLRKAYADYILTERVQYADLEFGGITPEGYAIWGLVNSFWHVVPQQKFSKVSSRTLRKRVRDQLAAQALIKPIT